MFKQFQRYVIYVLLVLSVLALGVCAWQRLRIKELRIENIKCRDANRTTAGTINELRDARTAAHKACEKTLRGKERALAELKRIDKLTPGGEAGVRGGSQSAIEGGSHAPTDTDPVLAELNGMFDRAAR